MFEKLCFQFKRSLINRQVKILLFLKFTRFSRVFSTFLEITEFISMRI